jgi:fructose-bisphosphate aldolase, class II
MKTLRQTLQEADGAHVAVGHFNFSDLTALQAIVEAAGELHLPVLVGVSEGEREFMGVPQVVALVKSFRDETGHAIFLNADHTHSLPKAEEAARAGFDEIIFDASTLPMEENVRATRKAIEAIKSISPSTLVEGEIGYIGTSSAVLDKTPAGMSPLTTPEEAKQFVDETGVDVLAPAVGNMHGLLKSMVRGEAHKHLDIERIGEIKRAAGVFMTLHGGSGTDDEDFKRAVKSGMTIIHVNTELRLAWRRGLEAEFSREPDEVAPYKLLPGALQAVKEVVHARLQLFNSN